MRRLQNNQREFYVFTSIREARSAHFWDPSAETRGANGYTIANLFRLYEPRPLRARTTLCLNALERKAQAIGFMRRGFLFLGLTQITPKSCYHGKHAEESSKQI
jgi:hypothetical protein